MQYDQAIDYILALPDMERFASGPGSGTMSLDAMKTVLESAGNPQEGRLTIHVTGSKGKGSTSTFIQAILEEAGLRSGLYTSPHLNEFTERIKIQGADVSKQQFAEGIAEIQGILSQVHNSSLGPISTFGALTVLFFHLCSKNRLDAQVVEVGMGGTHDATNVFQSKEIAVITPISLEHTAVLGKTCSEIAQEKSGIITPGCSAILAKQLDPSVKNIVAQRCQAVGAKLVDVMEKYDFTAGKFDDRGQQFTVAAGSSYALQTKLLGIHQIENAVTAVAVAEQLREHGYPIEKRAIDKGIERAYIPGRAQVISRDPIVVADGAHNAESAAALANTLKRHFPNSKIIFVVGVNQDKQIKPFISSLTSAGIHHLIATRSASAKAMNPQEIAHAAEGMAPRTVTDSVAAAIAKALELANDDSIVCVTGSLYVVGEARQYFCAGLKTP